MYGFSTHMPHPTDKLRFLLATEDMRTFKKRAYEQCIREVEHASFAPLVLLATGGMARQATSFYKRLATLLATK